MDENDAICYINATNERRVMLMIHLLFVVPYPELMEQVKDVVANHPEREKVNADVQALRVDEIPDIPAGAGHCTGNRYKFLSYPGHRGYPGG